MRGALDTTQPVGKERIREFLKNPRTFSLLSLTADGVILMALTNPLRQRDLCALNCTRLDLKSVLAPRIASAILRLTLYD